MLFSSVIKPILLPPFGLLLLVLGGLALQWRWRRLGWSLAAFGSIALLVLAMPISWKGSLQQYAGRLHREQADKTRVRIIDFIDAGHPALLRMWDRRQRGYQAMGYRIPPVTVGATLDFEGAAPSEAPMAV